MPTRIYLDQAATSWPKPECVYRAVDDYQRKLGAAAGRSAYSEAVEVAQSVQRARTAVARLIGAEHPSSVVFTFNGTDSLNVAIHGVLARGGHVVTSVAEHNSVLRPLRALEHAGAIDVTRIAVDRDGVVDADQVRRVLRPNTRLIALTHASNVTGTIQPVVEVGRIARNAGVLFLVDAAQTAGELPIDVHELQVDLLAAPGHKGLLGPLGTGVLYVRPGVEDRVDSFRQGGTGSFSENDSQPTVLPDKFESGNLNVPGIVGLGAGVAWLLSRDVDAVRSDGLVLTQRLLDRLRGIEGVTVYGPELAQDRVGLVSFTVQGVDPQEFAAILDSAYHVQGRAGLHCAPLMHQALGTSATGGTVRLSLGPFNTLAEIELAGDAIKEIAAQVGVA
jgi:cysteine desulfurase/selenocysteine lyase